MRERGKRIARLSLNLILLLLAIGLFASFDRLIEFWYLHKLASSSVSEMHIASEKLGEIGSPAAIPALLETLVVSRAHQSIAMARGDLVNTEPLGSSQDVEPQETLQDALKEALQKLTIRGGLAAAPYLIRGLHHSDWYVRQLSASLLGDLGQQAESALAELRQAASRDQNQAVRWRARLALSRIEARVKISRIEPGTGD